MNFHQFRCYLRDDAVVLQMMELTLRAIKWLVQSQCRLGQNPSSTAWVAVCFLHGCGAWGIFKKIFTSTRVRYFYVIQGLALLSLACHLLTVESFSVILGCFPWNFGEWTLQGWGRGDGGPCLHTFSGIQLFKGSEVQGRAACLKKQISRSRF